MDETLIHCVDDSARDFAHVALKIQFKEEKWPIEAGINIRPGAIDCLRKAN